MSAERDSLNRRLVRRLTHRSRTTSAIIAVLLFVVVIIAATALAVAVAAGFEPATRLADSAMSWLQDWRIVLAIGALLGVCGLLFIVLALSPGRLHRQATVSRQSGIVIDSTGLAETVADAVARGCGLPRNRVQAFVHRSAMTTIYVKRQSGVPVDAAAVEAEADRATNELGLTLRHRVKVREEGSLG